VVRLRGPLHAQLVHKAFSNGTSFVLPAPPAPPPDPGQHLLESSSLRHSGSDHQRFTKKPTSYLKLAAGYFPPSASHRRSILARVLTRSTIRPRHQHMVQSRPQLLQAPARRPATSDRPAAARS